MWVHLHILKRGGAAHNHGGVESLSDGSMAVECPVCPHPGRNIDADAVRNMVFLNFLFDHLAPIL